MNKIDREELFRRMKAVALGEDKSNTCICCKELVDIKEENITIQATYENGDKNFVYPCCDDCKHIVIDYLLKD